MAESTAAHDDDDSDDLPLPKKTRVQVARDVLVFQVKLFADGLRDLLLSPVSIVLGVIGILISRRPGEPFYRLLRAGRATEAWLDLFGDAFPEEDSVDTAARRESGRRDLERHLRALEKSLSGEDFDKGTRESIARMRDALKKIPLKRGGDSRDTDDTSDSPG